MSGGQIKKVQEQSEWLSQLVSTDIILLQK